MAKRPAFAPGKFQSCVDRLNAGLAELAGEEHIDGDTRRLTNRLRKYGEYIFTFPDYSDLPFENNFAERQIRPAVILRKDSQSSRSERRSHEATRGVGYFGQPSDTGPPPAICVVALLAYTPGHGNDRYDHRPFV